MKLTIEELERLFANSDFQKFLSMLIEKKDEKLKSLVNADLTDKEMHFKIGEIRALEYVISFPVTERTRLTAQKNIAKIKND